MSKLRSTSKDIKKKLSFKDYHEDSHQESETEQHAGVSSQQHNGATDRQYNSVPVEPDASTAQRYKDAKVKVTYYLGKEEHEMLKQLYIDMLKKQSKADRSALICQAIRVLYAQYHSE